MYGHNKRWIFALTSCAALLILSWPATSAAQKVVLSWDANAEKDIAGYQLHYANKSGAPYKGTFADQGPSPIDIPLSSFKDPTKLRFELTGVPPCSDIFLSLKAYNKKGKYSDLAEEISARVVYRPKDVKAELAPGGVKVRWTLPMPAKSDKIKRYLIYYREGSVGDRAVSFNKPPMPVSAVANSENAVVNLPGLNGPDIFVAVAAECESGESQLSDVYRLDIFGGSDSGELSGGCSVASTSSSHTGFALALLGLCFFISRRRR